MTSLHPNGSARGSLTPGLGQPRLINNTCFDTSNLCYTNCIVQLLSNSGIRDKLPTVLLNSMSEDYPTARALLSLYKEGGEEKSASQLRR